MNVQELLKNANFRVVSGDARPYAVVEEKTGMVINKISWDASSVSKGPSYDYDPGEGNILIELPLDSPVYIGWTYKDGQFNG